MSIREEVVQNHGKETLNEPHQRVDSNPKFEEYEFKERGFWCSECGVKCTIGLNGEEYGHCSGCTHRNVGRNTSH